MCYWPPSQFPTGQTVLEEANLLLSGGKQMGQGPKWSFGSYGAGFAVLTLSPKPLSNLSYLSLLDHTSKGRAGIGTQGPFHFRRQCPRAPVSVWQVGGPCNEKSRLASSIGVCVALEQYPCHRCDGYPGRAARRRSNVSRRPGFHPFLKFMLQPPLGHFWRR